MNSKTSLLPQERLDSPIAQRLIILALIGCLSFAPGKIEAANYTYTAPGAATTTWSLGTNWNSAPLSDPSNHLTFIGNYSTAVSTISKDDIAGAFQLNILDLNGSNSAFFTTANLTISGSSSANTLEFTTNSGTAPVINLNATVGNTSSILNDTVSINATIDGPITFQGNGSANFIFSGTLSDGTSAASITKNGTSTLALSGSNAFTGGVTLNAGGLGINNAKAIGSGTLTINGGTLYSSGTALSTNNVQNWNGDFGYNSNNSNYTTGSVTTLNLGTGAVTMGGNRTINAASGTLIVGGNIVDSGSNYSLTKTGAGTLVLNGSNTYGGGTVINGGVLQVLNSNSFGTTGSNVLLNYGGALAVGYALDQATLQRIAAGSVGTIALSSTNSSNNLDFSGSGINSAVTLGASGTSTYSGVLTPQGNTYRFGGAGGTLILTNALTDVSGTTSLVVGGGGSAGTVTLNAAATYSGSTTVIGAAGSTASVLQSNVLAGVSTTPFGTNPSMMLDNGTIGLGTAATLASGNVMNVTGYNVIFSGQDTIKLAVGSGSSVTFASNSLSQSAAGADVLFIAPTSGANLGTKEFVKAANGAPSVTNGMVAPYYVDVTSKNFLTYGANGFVDATATTVSGSAAWDALGDTSNTIVSYTGAAAFGTRNVYALIINNNISIGGSVNIGSGGVIFVGTGGNSFSTALNFGNAHAYFGALGTGGFSVAGTITGSNGITFYGTQNIDITSAMSVTGGITIDGNVSYDFNGSNSWNTSNGLTVAKSGVLSFNRGITQTFVTLNGEGSIFGNPVSNNFSSVVTLAVSGTGADSAFSGILGGSLLSFSKGGNNTQILSGNNTYTQGTTVTGGKLLGTQNFGTPFGTGNISITNSILGLAPSGTGGRISLSAVNSGTGSTFTYNADSQINLDKGANTNLTYTIGNSAAAANSVLVAQGGVNRSTLLIAPASGLANLGTASGEKFIVNGGVAITNGIVSAAIIGQDTDSNKSGSFLGYNSVNGFVTGTYNDTNFASANSGSVEDVNSATSVNTQTVYALRTSAALSINSGNTLTIGNNTATNPAGVILNGGGINSGTLAFGNSPGVVYSSMANGTIGSSITGANGVSFDGPGTTTLTGSNSFGGGMVINNTTVSVTNSNNLSSSGASVTLNGGTLQATAGFSTSRNFVVNIGQNTAGGTFDVANGNTLTLSGSVSGSGSLTKMNSGTLVLTGGTANSYSGVTNVLNGTLSINTVATGASAQSLGKGSAVNLGVAGTSSGILLYTGTVGTLDKNINAFGNGNDTVRNGGTGLLTLSGTLSKNGTVLTLNGGASGINVTGLITGASSGSDLVITGGTTTLSSANSYNGPTYVYGVGVLQSGTTNALPTNTVLTLGESSGNTNGTYDLNGFNQTVAGLKDAGTGSRIVTNNAAGSGTSVFTVNNDTSTSNANYVFGGVIRDGATAHVALVKSGDHTLTLTGINSYTGGTTINAGTLIINGNSAGATGAVAVNSGGTLAGTGTLGGGSTLVTIAGGGAINLVDNSIGTLYLGGGLTIGGTAGSSSALSFEYGSGGVDSVAAGGSLTLSAGGGIISLTNFGGAISSGTYNLLTYTSESLTGGLTFAGGATSQTIGSQTFTLQNTSTAEQLVVTSGNSSQLVLSSGSVSLSLGRVLVGKSASTTTTLTNSGATGNAEWAFGTTGGVSVNPNASAGTNGGTGVVLTPSGSNNQVLTVAVSSVGNTSGSSKAMGTFTGSNTSNTAGGVGPVNVTADVYDAANLTVSGSGTGTMTVSNASDPGGLRATAELYNVSVTNAQSGWSTSLSGTTLVASGSSVTAASFDSTNKLNGTYTGILTVSAQNDHTLTGATANDVINGGTYGLTVSISGQVASAGQTYSAGILAGQSYAGYGLTSGTTGGLHGMVATLLAGTASGSTTVNMTFNTAPNGHGTNSFLSSDVLTLSGVTALGGTGHDGSILTDTFVLQLSYTTNPNVGATPYYIGWWDANTAGGGAWVNAIAGNDNSVLPRDYSGGPTTSGQWVTGDEFLGSYSAFLADNANLYGYGSASDLSWQLGAYGYDSSTGTAWAVLDHNSDFAVIPEPQTWGMIVAGFGMLIGLHGLRRRRVGA